MGILPRLEFGFFQFLGLMFMAFAAGVVVGTIFGGILVLS